MNYYQKWQKQNDNNITAVIFIPCEISDYGNSSKI